MLLVSRRRSRIISAVLDIHQEYGQETCLATTALRNDMRLAVAMKSKCQRFVFGTVQKGWERKLRVIIAVVLRLFCGSLFQEVIFPEFQDSHSLLMKNCMRKLKYVCNEYDHPIPRPTVQANRLLFSVYRPIVLSTYFFLICAFSTRRKNTPPPLHFCRWPKRSLCEFHALPCCF